VKKNNEKRKKRPLKTDKTTIENTEKKISTKLRQITKIAAYSNLGKVTRKLLLKHHYLLLLAVAIWNISDLPTRVQALNFSMEHGAKCKGEGSGLGTMLGVLLVSRGASHPLQYSRR